MGGVRVHALTFRTPDFKHHITYRDKGPPPQDWSGFITDPLGWFHLYAKVQSMNKDEPTYLKVASNIREFVTDDKLPPTAPIPSNC